MVLDTPRKDCPYVFQKKPTLPSSSRQALRGNDGISRARAESHIAECANARFRPPFFFCTLPPRPITLHATDGRLSGFLRNALPILDPPCHLTGFKLRTAPCRVLPPRMKRSSSISSDLSLQSTKRRAIPHFDVAPQLSVARRSHLRSVACWYCTR